MKPDMKTAENKYNMEVTVYYDIASKMYGIRETQSQVKDGVYVEATKHIDMTLEQLIELNNKISGFLETHKKFEK